MKPVPTYLVVGACLLLAFGVVRGADQPRISCDAPAYDFGTLDQSNTVEHVFVIRNLGTAPLQMTHVHACCGATAVLTTNLLAPGESAGLVSRTALQGRNGPMKKTFYIKSNDPEQPQYPLYLQGDVHNSMETLKVANETTPSVQVQPAIIDFGQIRNDSVVVRSFVVTSQEAPFQVDRFDCSTPWFVAETDAGYTRQSRQEVRIKTRPPLPMGVVTGAVRIITGPMGATTVTVSVIARVFADLVVSPEEIHLVAGETMTNAMTRYLAIRSRSGTPFMIRKVDCQDKDIGINVQEIKSGNYRITLSNVLPRGELHGKTLKIETDNPDAPMIEIPFIIQTGYK